MMMMMQDFYRLFAAPRCTVCQQVFTETDKVRPEYFAEKVTEK